jgi:hypothetical protein
MREANGTRSYYALISDKKSINSSRSIHEDFMRASSEGDMLVFVFRKPLSSK